jgi:YebC/PmpR family DNA-binding regulatory protein
MAGHSKWANIRHRKGAQDAKRGKIFTRLIREITVAARMGDPDPAMNPRLRLAIDKAKAESMPKDNIERAIRRGAGHLEDSDYQEVRYEGYGPGGTAVMVECLTDNRNRTVADVRHAFSKHGGNLGSDGSVAYLFTHCGVISYGPGVDEHTVLEAALEAGAEDVVTNDDGSIDVITQPQSFETVRDAMQEAGLRADSAEVTMRPEALAHLEEEQASSMLKMVDMLEDLDDVQNVYTNADIDAEVLQRMADQDD